MNNKEATSKVISMIPEDFSMSFEELKKEILKEGNSIDGYPHKKSKRGYSVFYTDNDNFMQGAWNGGGVGFFARLQGVGMTSTIKL